MDRKERVLAAIIIPLMLVMSAGAVYKTNDLLSNSEVLTEKDHVVEAPTLFNSTNRTVGLYSSSFVPIPWTGNGPLTVRVEYEEPFALTSAKHMAHIEVLDFTGEDLCTKDTLHFESFFRTVPVTQDHVAFTSEDLSWPFFDHLVGGDRCYARAGGGGTFLLTIYTEGDGIIENPYELDGVLYIDEWDLIETIEVTWP